MGHRHPPGTSTNGSTNGQIHSRKIPETLLSGIWQQIQSAELAILSSVSLQTLVNQYQRLEHQRRLDVSYMIFQ